MTISGVSGSNNVGAMPAMTGGQISPDSVMAYCASQLRSLDTGIKERMAKQQEAHDIASALTGVRTSIAVDHMGTDGRVEKGRVVAAFEEAFAKLPPGDPMRDKLNDAFHDFVTTAYCKQDGNAGNQYNLGYMTDAKHAELDQAAANNGALNDVSNSELKDLGLKIDALTNDISKNAELEMINLQSMVSQRQMAIQLTTQMISKMNEGQMSIVNQVGK
jgi:hypothetical protein